MNSEKVSELFEIQTKLLDADRRIKVAIDSLRRGQDIIAVTNISQAIQAVNNAAQRLEWLK